MKPMGNKNVSKTPGKRQGLVQGYVLFLGLVGNHWKPLGMARPLWQCVMFSLLEPTGLLL